MALYAIYNGPMPGAAALVPITTGTTIKTLLQVAPAAYVTAKVVEWGISFDGSAAATPGRVELIETTVAATVTASVTADIMRLDGKALMAGDPIANFFLAATAAQTGYTASAEGTITTGNRLLDYALLPPTAPYVKQFPLGREPIIQLSKFLRIRVLFGTAILAACYVVLEV